MSQVEVDQKTYQMPPKDGITVAHFLTRRRRRTIAQILRKGLRRPHSEQRRQQRRAGLPSDREHVAPRQPRGRSDTGQTNGNPQRPPRSR